jgi:predicted aspartyl protease
VGRIIKEIEIEGQRAMALFDTGPIYTYVRESLVAQCPRAAVVVPVRVALGGQSIQIRELCLMNGKIEGLDFSADAVPVADLGSADGHTLDVIIGATTLEKWEIRIDPKTGTLDVEGLRRREFTEY